MEETHVEAIDLVRTINPLNFILDKEAVRRVKSKLIL
jgi:hypothetical protein